MQERENQTGESAEEPRVRVMTKAALVVGGAAVVAFLIFVAVPVLFVAAGIGVTAWLLLRFIRG